MIYDSDDAATVAVYYRVVLKCVNGLIIIWMSKSMATQWLFIIIISGSGNERSR